MGDVLDVVACSDLPGAQGTESGHTYGLRSSHSSALFNPLIRSLVAICVEA